LIKQWLKRRAKKERIMKKVKKGKNVREYKGKRHQLKRRRGK
jgi:hypothetical protein